MPIEPPDPLVTAAFLAALLACRWDAKGYVATAAGTPEYLNGSSGTWTLASSGLVVSHATYTLLVGGAANADGTFTSRGTTYNLHDNGIGSAVAVKA